MKYSAWKEWKSDSIRQPEYKAGNLKGKTFRVLN